MSNKPDGLPAFLTPLLHSTSSVPRQAVLDHATLGPAHSLWWNHQTTAEHPEAVLLFVPGNPGLVDFYIDYLAFIHRRNPHLALFAHAHLSHTPRLPSREFGLDVQVQSAIEALDAVRAAFPKTKIILAGHSVGSWIALQVLKARPDDVFSIFLLCPTIMHIADTPNGRRLSWVFRTPLPWIASWLSYLTRPLHLTLLFRHWPASQVSVLRNLLNSPSTIFACLSMAHEEMQTIRELDVSVIREHTDRLHIYFAAADDWVSGHKTTILRTFLPADASRVIEGDIPHAFCISHSEQVAAQCCDWLDFISLRDTE